MVEHWPHAVHFTSFETEYSCQVNVPELHAATQFSPITFTCCTFGVDIKRICKICHNHVVGPPCYMELQQFCFFQPKEELTVSFSPPELILFVYLHMLEW